MSNKVTRLANNLIGTTDREILESYGKHAIVHGWATRFAWDEEDGDPRFDIFRGGVNEELALRIGRHRESDEFFAQDAAGQQIVAGTLDHVMAEMDAWLNGEPKSGPSSA